MILVVITVVEFGAVSLWVRLGAITWGTLSQTFYSVIGEGHQGRRQGVRMERATHNMLHRPSLILKLHFTRCARMVDEVNIGCDYGGRCFGRETLGYSPGIGSPYQEVYQKVHRLEADGGHGGFAEGRTVRVGMYDYRITFYELF